MTDIIDELMGRIRDDLYEVDADKAYDEFLDEIYSFDSLGGIFASMQPSRVLEKMDPVAYRCGFSDWLGGEDLIDIGKGVTEYYRRDDMEEILDAFVGELESERDDLQSELDDLDPSEADNVEECDSLENDITALDAKIDQLRKYVF